MRNLIQRDEQPDRIDRPYQAARMLGVARLRPNPRQPRQTFEPASLAELARSIGEHGMLQPIVVRPMGTDWEIVVGERRWRAAQKAGLNAIPCIVRSMDDATADLYAVVENIHREDLDPAELYRGLQRLRDDGDSLRDIGKRIGKGPDWISNKLGSLAHELTGPHVLAGHISLTAAEEVTRAPVEFQPRMLQAALAGEGKGPLRELRQSYERGELPAIMPVGRANGHAARPAPRSLPGTIAVLRGIVVQVIHAEDATEDERAEVERLAEKLVAWANR